MLAQRITESITLRRNGQSNTCDAIFRQIIRNGEQLTLQQINVHERRRIPRRQPSDGPRAFTGIPQESVWQMIRQVPRQSHRYRP